MSYDGESNYYELHRNDSKKIFLSSLHHTEYRFLET